MVVVHFDVSCFSGDLASVVGIADGRSVLASMRSLSCYGTAALPVPARSCDNELRVAVYCIRSLSSPYCG